MMELSHDRAALVAAAQAAEALAELLRFHGEGPHAYSAFGEVDVVGKLAEALLHATRIERDHMSAKPEWTEDREELSQLGAACAKFIDGWVG